MKEIIVDIFDDGEVKVTTKGYAGKSCVEESQFIKDVLGHELARQLTPAYFGQNVKKHLPLCG